VANSTDSTVQDATPDLNEAKKIFESQWPKVQEYLETFWRQAPTPEGTYNFEIGLKEVAQEGCRLLLEHIHNRIEPETLEDCPVRLHLGSEEYKRRPKSRNIIGTLFGRIRSAKHVLHGKLRWVFPFLETSTWDRAKDEIHGVSGLGVGICGSRATVA
jgi:hypothetical protein